MEIGAGASWVRIQQIFAGKNFHCRIGRRDVALAHVGDHQNAFRCRRQLIYADNELGIVILPYDNRLAHGAESGGGDLESEPVGCAECEKESSIRRGSRLRENLIPLEELHGGARQSISRWIENPPSDSRILREDEKRQDHHRNQSDPTSARASF
jgi:hypothetical protein